MRVGFSTREGRARKENSGARAADPLRTSTRPSSSTRTLPSPTTIAARLRRQRPTRPRHPGLRPGHQARPERRRQLLRAQPRQGQKGRQGRRSCRPRGGAAHRSQHRAVGAAPPGLVNETQKIGVSGEPVQAAALFGSEEPTEEGPFLLSVDEQETIAASDLLV
jgi:hypothetical protein